MSVPISWDLEKSPILIKTDSALGSGDEVKITTYKSDGTELDTFRIVFQDHIKYRLKKCFRTITPLQVQPPESTLKVWKIEKNSTALKIWCNEILVQEYMFELAESSLAEKCSAAWSGDKVDRIKFDAESKGVADSIGAEPIYTCAGKRRSLQDSVSWR